MSLLTDTGLGSCLLLAAGLAAAVWPLVTNKKPGAGTPGEDSNS